MQALCHISTPGVPIRGLLPSPLNLLGLHCKIALPFAKERRFRSLQLRSGLHRHSNDGSDRKRPATAHAGKAELRW
jgi:hypothetical protein